MRVEFPSLRRSRLASLAAALATLTSAGAASVAWAQDAAPAAAADPAAADPAAAAPATEPVKAAPKTKEKAAVPDVGVGAIDLGGADADLYGVSNDVVPPGSRMDWAERRDIRVVQKRAVVKEGRHGFSLLGGVVPNDDFWTYVSGGLGYNYYLSEDLAISVHGAYTRGVESSLRKKLQASRDEGGYELGVRFPQSLNGYASVGVDWNLMHGKIRFFGTRLFEFDLAATVGLGTVFTTVTTQKYPDGNQRIDAAGNIGGYVQFYLTDRLAFRLDVHQLFFPGYNDASDDASGGLTHPLATMLALTWFTAAPQ